MAESFPDDGLLEVYRLRAAQRTGGAAVNGVVHNTHRRPATIPDDPWAGVPRRNIITGEVTTVDAMRKRLEDNLAAASGTIAEDAADVTQGVLPRVVEIPPDHVRADARQLLAGGLPTAANP